MDFSQTIFIEKTRSKICEESKIVKGTRQIELNVNKPTNKTRSTLDLHSDNVNFVELTRKMKPVSVEGLEHITGVLGLVEDCILDQENTHNAGNPKDGALFWGHIALYCEGSSKHFDCSQCGGAPHTLQLLESTTLPGILVACRSLRPGQSGQFLLPPHTMFGDLGCPPKVPKSSTILMRLISLKWIDVQAPNRFFELDEDTRKDFAVNLNLLDSTNEAAANEFHTKKYKPSLAYYEKLIEMLKSFKINNDYYDEIQRYKFKTYVNMATCYVMLDKPLIAFWALDEASVLKDKQNCKYYKSNCKYLFTRGKCHMMMHEYEDAYNFLMSALDLEPNNIQIADEIIKLDPIISRHKNDEKSFIKNIFATSGDYLSNIKINEDTEKSVRDLCEDIIASDLLPFPVPGFLLEEEEKILNDIVNTFDNLTIVSKTLNGEVEKFFAKKVDL